MNFPVADEIFVFELFQRTEDEFKALRDNTFAVLINFRQNTH